MKVLKQFDAQGMEGFLLVYPDFSTAEPTGEISPTGQRIVKCKDTIVAFRVYEYDEHGKHKRDEKGRTIFKDYKIRHHDLRIKLLDGHIYETDEGGYIDYPGLRYYQNGSEAGNSDPPRPEDAEG